MGEWHDALISATTVGKLGSIVLCPWERMRLCILKPVGRSNEELLQTITEIVNRMAECDDDEARDALDAEARASISEDEIRRLTEEEPESMHEMMSVLMAWSVQWAHPELARVRELSPDSFKIKKR